MAHTLYAVVGIPPRRPERVRRIKPQVRRNVALRKSAVCGHHGVRNFVAMLRAGSRVQIKRRPEGMPERLKAEHEIIPCIRRIAEPLVELAVRCEVQKRAFDTLRRFFENIRTDVGFILAENRARRENYAAVRDCIPVVAADNPRPVRLVAMRDGL